MAEDAEQLMRSRFTAYRLQDEAYILETWHPDYRPQTLSLTGDVQWTGLRVIRHQPGPGEDEARVEFIASYLADGEPGQMHEISRFLRQDGRWYYLDGEQVESTQRRAMKMPGRNDPCYCGSGRKFKKCCGRSG